MISFSLNRVIEMNTELEALLLEEKTLKGNFRALASGRGNSLPFTVMS